MNIDKISDSKLCIDFIINTFHDYDCLNFSDNGIISFESFVKEKVNLFECICAYENEDLVGTLIYDQKDHHIVLIIVKKDYQRKGIARRLFEFLCEYELKNHISCISVHSSENSIDFYKSLGLKIEGEVEKSGNINFCNMEYLLGKENLGKVINVIVEHTIGEPHSLYPDIQYLCNYGYVEEVLKNEGEFQNAYIYGVDEPINSFEGIVIAIIYRKGFDDAQWVVSKVGQTIKHDEIKKLVGFQEQFYETQFIFLDEQ